MGGIPNATSSARYDVEQLRLEYYNAVVEQISAVYDDLRIIRVQPDGEVPKYLPGQFTTLGLGIWEPRINGVEAARDNSKRNPHRLIVRAYSIGCPLLDKDDRLVRCADCDFLEFYITLVHRSTDDPPPLTPRLFDLQEGDRLFVGMKAHGRYTLEPVDSDDDVVFAATGTGEAPHNAMTAELLSRGHRGRIVNLCCVRYRRDAAYEPMHRRLERQYPNYRYLALTTREPENVDPTHADYAGKQYLQNLFATDGFQEAFDWEPDPLRAHVYLCGNPAMIGLPRHDDDGRAIYPEPAGMVEALVRHGFSLDERGKRGNIHIEKFW